MTELRNDRLLRALMREPVDLTPVWIMRQAGRYLPEYRETRKRAGSFLKLCTTPELACEVTLQPIERYPLDAAIVFSDILTIPDAMGLGLTVNEGEGPRFARPLRSRGDIERLAPPDPETDLRYVMDAIRLVRSELAGRVPLIGFSGSPWTLAAYMVEGQSPGEFKLIKSLMRDAPADAHRLLQVLAGSVTAYLNAQIAAGAQTVMIFDTWGGALDTEDYRVFSLQYMAQIVSGLVREAQGRAVPVILFTKGGGAWLEDMADTGCDALSIDWNLGLSDARRRVGERVALQGNMDPQLLFEAPSRIRQEVATILEGYGRGPGHVFNLGHGITPKVDPDHVSAFIDAVHELSAPFHQ